VAESILLSAGDKAGRYGELDVDSRQPAAFDEIDAAHLDEVARLVADLAW
jgi:putative methionine-R-sulfoxide reductase with GAF domain